jgi:restriction endonuclease S subunit
MEEILLKDICDLDNGYAFKSDDYVEASDTLNCRMSNIRPDGTFDILYSAKYLPNEFAEKYEDYLLNDGDLIIAMTDMAGDPKILGVPTVVDTKGYKLLLNQRVGKLRFIKPGVNADYLKLALQSKRVREYLKRFAGGGVQLNVSKKDILNAPVRMRTEEEQDYIAGLFRRILEIKKQREQELLCLDNLIKARFVEMFGDPETNPFGWEQMTLNDVCSSVVRGPFGSALKKEFFVEPGENTYKVYEQKHAIQKSAEIGTYYISEEKYNELKRFECLPGDILMSCSGTMGELYQLPEGCAKGVINQALCKFTLNEKILPVCFLEYMRQTIGNLETKGSGIQNIAAVSYVKAMPINVPTMDVQRQFASFVEQVDKSKVAVQKSLDETQRLFDSLMQEYFG